MITIAHLLDAAGEQWRRRRSGVYLKDELPVAGELTVILNRNTPREEVQHYKNLFVKTGANSIADALRGSLNRGVVTYCAVGTGTVAPVKTDTQLQTELFRKTITVRSVALNVATFEIFYTTSEANGALREAGLFGDDASATVNSGTLFCRTAINRTKTSSDTLYISWAVTIGAGL